MLHLFIILLTLFMVLDCLALILLVLMQLPKKEAGAGLAFGGAATDALFGAGSGNFLTKATKYAAIIFFGSALLLSVLENQQSSSRSHTDFGRKLEQQQQQQRQPQAGTPAPANNTPAATSPENTAAVADPGSNNFSLAIPPSGTSTNPAAAPKK